MPSPFPGMDPFLAGEDWPDFHLAMIAEIRSVLVAQIRPRYIARAERRVFVEHADETTLIRPDVTVAHDESGRAAPPVASTASATLEPISIALPIPVKHEEPFLTIRLTDTREVVTVIELLSPANKRPGSDGRREYIAKRESVLQSGTHLVELDLLRGGRRMPTLRPLPACDYLATISRVSRRPTAEIYAWTLRDRLPSIPIPLDAPDPDVHVDLQQAFTRVYDETGYDYSLDYGRTLDPPLTAEEATLGKR